jgi:Protein of unknown function (DUF2807).
MQIKSLLLTLLACVITLHADAQIFKKVIGNDKYETRSYKVNDFSKVTISHPLNVVYKANPDSAGYISIYGESNILDLISLKSEKGNLSIKLNGMRTPEFGVILIRMYSSQLNNVVNEGGSSFEILSPINDSEIKLSVIGTGQIKAGQIDCGLLNVNISGGGDILVKGTAGMGDYSVTGKGEIRANDVVANEANATITGSGTIRCNATKSLKTFLTGNGKIIYSGQPELKTRTIGTGQVVPAE